MTIRYTAGGLFILGSRQRFRYADTSGGNNLPGITGVGENFLVTGKAGGENDFAAAARSRRLRGR